MEQENINCEFHEYHLALQNGIFKYHRQAKTHHALNHPTSAHPGKLQLQ
jgi:hypothetical protein